MADAAHASCAPAVQYPVGRSAVAARIGGALAAASALAWVLWFAQSQHPGWRQWLCGLCWVAATAWGVQSWRASPQGTLHWDGQGWLWTPRRLRMQAVRGTLAVHLDGQAFLMVLWHSEDRSRSMWMALERGRDPRRWPDLRRAVYSRARSGGPASPADAGAPRPRTRPARP